MIEWFNHFLPARNVLVPVFPFTAVGLRREWWDECRTEGTRLVPMS
jgi:hypothetical protein